MTLDATYRRTEAGDEALRSEDAAIPVDYRRMLCVIEGDTHVNVVRGRLRRYRDSLIDAWLGELEELGFIETAGAALHGKGAYLSQDRLQNRAPLAKDASQITVLLVEDDSDQAALADLRISMAGYRVRLARSRRETLEDLATRAPADVVLLDVRLPDGNGFEILAGMRRHARFALVPVIVLTSLSSAEDIRRGLDLGADGYMTKPYSKDLLVDTIRQVLRLA